MAKTPVKPILFISHIGEEREIATALKNLIESEYRGLIDVFVSSSPDSIHAGQKWLDKIDDALTQCKVEIIIASPTSLRRPWVNFEAGAGWVRRIPVIPLCHSGMTFEKLPKPLDSFQGAIATDEAGLRQIFHPIAAALGGSVPTNIDFSGFIEIVKSYEVLTAQNASLVQDSTLQTSEGLADHESTTLIEAAELASSPNSKLYVLTIMNAVETRGFRKIAAMLAIKMLERKQLIEMIEEYDDFNRCQDWYARITEEGWIWLQNNIRGGQLKTVPRDVADSSTVPDEVPF